MKITKHKNILGLLYGLLLLIPFASVLARTAYVALNKNANESWSGQEQVNINYRYETNDVNTIDDLIVGNIYKFTYQDDFTASCRIGIQTLVFDESTIINYNYQTISTSYDLTIRTNYTFPSQTQNFKVVAFTRFNNGLYMFSTVYTDYYFVYGNTQFNTNINAILPLISKSDYIPIDNVIIEEDTLDNAFEYSLKEITNNDIGKVKFFTWFADMFLDVNDGTSSIYIGFINWYFNYALLMSLGYVLFGVLMWFINWVRRMIERGQDFGQGGF